MKASRSAIALVASTLAVPAIVFAAYCQEQGKSPASPRWSPEQLHAWIQGEFQRTPDVAALIRDVIATDGEYYDARSAGRADAEPAVKAIATRKDQLMAKYFALWTERYDEIRRRAPAEVIAEAPRDLELEARIQSLFKADSIVSALVQSIVAVDQDIDRLANEGRGHADAAFKAAAELKSDLTAKYNTLWNERYAELRRRVLANIKEGAPDDLEGKITSEFQRDPALGRLIWDVQAADRDVVEARRAGRGRLDPALAAAEKRQDELWTKYHAAWSEHYDEFRRRILTGADEFAPWRVDARIGQDFANAPDVAPLMEEMSATDLETAKVQDGPARKALERRKAELSAKYNALWTERYPGLRKQAVVELQNTFVPPHPQQPEAKHAPAAPERGRQAPKVGRAFTKMAIAPGSPEPYLFTPIPETIAARVSGAARDERSEPIAKAKVTLYAVTREGVKPAATTTTDAEGGYDFRGIHLPVLTSSKLLPNQAMPPHIRFLVSGEAPGKGIAWGRGLSMWQFNPENLDENGGQGHLFLQSNVTLDLKFGKAAALHGRIVDERGEPIPGAKVRVVNHAEIDADGREAGNIDDLEWNVLPDGLGRSQTGADGGFRIEGLTERFCYSLVVTRPESTRTEFSLFAATVDGPDQDHKPTSVGSIFLGTHQARTSPVTITVPKLRPIDVLVLADDDGKPVAGAHIQMRAELGASESGDTDDAGKIRLHSPPGEHVYLISNPPARSRYLPTYQDPIDVKPGETPSPLEIRQKVGAELIIEAVETGTGKPMPDVFFWWTAEGPPDEKSRSAEDVSTVLRTAWTDEKGELHATVAPAPGRRYRFHFGGMREPVTSWFDPFAARTYGYEASPAQSEPVELAPGKPTRLRFELRKGPPDPNPYRPRVRQPAP
ncbi:carboxypeptidase regulatory-like domain-containing protein [Paludisphaera borealis]|uniref:Carboxypeptidase regulatory-like domain-containing protein n=1 Tax=Paludisphaera borealis TaxID=1387353 RepID=A0A1U7CSS4_9BACT|nr:carboxypeptidase regulatory-like domain-containing protein [Paludisphaera borealis]APW61982.1 hypothetical protein BSF38_03514 [Paludisphaera borealis]